MKRNKTVLEECLSLKGGDPKDSPLFGKTVDEMVGEGLIKTRGVHQDPERKTVLVDINSHKNGDYPSSSYLEKFFGAETGKKPIKEDFRMKNKRPKSVLSTILEDLENDQGFVGIGEDDGELGAPGFDSAASVDQGSADVADMAKQLDSQLDGSAVQDQLFGDDQIPGEKATVANESARYIHNKKQFRGAVNALFHNLAELSVLSYLPVHRYGKQEHKIVVESMYRGITESKKPVLWESMTPKAKTTISKKIAYFQERRDAILAKPTKRTACIVERYLIKTNRLLKEVGEQMGDSAVNPTEAPVASSVPNSAAVGVAATFGAAMGALKSKISQCNENPDMLERALCQVAAYDEALGLVRGLTISCQDDECKAKVMKAVGRLEVMKANAQTEADKQDAPAAPPEEEVAPPSEAPAADPMAGGMAGPLAGAAPGMPPAGAMPAGPMGVPPAMPAGAPPAPAQQVPTEQLPPEEEQFGQVAQEFFNLSLQYESYKPKK